MPERKPHLKGGTIPGTTKCRGCGAAPGELHDHGCDWEQCPVCGEQLIGCDHASVLLEEEPTEG